MAKKILQLVTCCDDCPRKSYYSGGRSECTEAGTILPYNEGHRIPEWCPLVNYPSDAMERMRERISDLESIISKKPQTASEIADVLVATGMG